MTNELRKRSVPEAGARATPGALCAASLRQALFTLVTASTFFGDVKEWSEQLFDAQQLDIRLNFDVDVKKAAVDVRKT